MGGVQEFATGQEDPGRKGFTFYPYSRCNTEIISWRGIGVTGDLEFEIPLFLGGSEYRRKRKEFAFLLSGLISR